MFNNGVNPKKGGCMSDGSNIREEVAAIIYVSEVFVCLVFFIIIASKTHREKKQKLHKINKVIKRKKTTKKQIANPRRLESVTICRCHYKGSTFFSVI